MKAFFSKLIVSLILIIISHSSAFSQTLSPTDLKLLIDGQEIKDSTITIEGLYKIKEITTNFSWLKFNFLVFHWQPRTGFSSVITAQCPGNRLCDDAKNRILKHLKPGETIMIEAGESQNSSGHLMKVQDLVLHIQ